MEKKLPTARLNSAQSKPAQRERDCPSAAARVRARLAPVRATVAAPASAGSKRIANNESPSSAAAQSQRAAIESGALIDVTQSEMAPAGDVSRARRENNRSGRLSAGEPATLPRQRR